MNQYSPRQIKIAIHIIWNRAAQRAISTKLSAPGTTGRCQVPQDGAQLPQDITQLPQDVTQLPQDVTQLPQEVTQLPQNIT